MQQLAHFHRFAARPPASRLGLALGLAALLAHAGACAAAKGATGAAIDAGATPATTADGVELDNVADTATPDALADGAAPAWRLSGFGSLGLAHSNEAQADFSANTNDAAGAGHSRAWSPDVDSRLGAQLDVALAPRWSATLQLLSERRRDDGYRPTLESANLKYQLAPELSLRAGRVVLPLLMAGDYRKIGYALPWVRTPVELYGILPISSVDGADALYRWSAAGVKHVTEVVAGTSELQIGDHSYVHADDLVGWSDTATCGALSLRAAATSADLRVDQGRARHSLTGTLGVNYDPGSWFLTGELVRVDASSVLGGRTGWYLGGGRRAGDWTPYLTYAHAKLGGNARLAGLDLRDMGEPPAGLPLRPAAEQHTLSAGLRWDVLPGRALKLQYDRVRPQGGTEGLLINVQPGYLPGRSIGVLSLVADLVF